jgi:hypothetical protein
MSVVKRQFEEARLERERAAAAAVKAGRDVISGTSSPPQGRARVQEERLRAYTEEDHRRTEQEKQVQAQAAQEAKDEVHRQEQLIAEAAAEKAVLEQAEKVAAAREKQLADMRGQVERLEGYASRSKSEAERKKASVMLGRKKLELAKAEL